MQIINMVARLYDPILGQFISVDPMADLYPGWAPYVYCYNNPLVFVDPTGETVWIYDYDENGEILEILQYVEGMEYEGDSEFMASAVETLNDISEIDEGCSVVSELINSSNSFDIKNIDSEGGPRTLQLSYEDEKYTNGGAEIRAAALVEEGMSKNTQFTSVAHEMFHGFQRENGQNPATVNGEVGAYLYGVALTDKSKYGNYGMTKLGNESADGAKYDKAMLEMMWGSKTNLLNNYNSALNTFKSGSRANSGGLYQNHKIDQSYTPQVFKFFPN